MSEILSSLISYLFPITNIIKMFDPTKQVKFSHTKLFFLISFSINNLLLTNGVDQQCELGWTFSARSQACYRLFKQDSVKTYPEAVKLCQSNGGVIPTIHNQQENKEVHDMAFNPLGDHVIGNWIWLGAIEEKINCKSEDRHHCWKWNDETRVNTTGYTNWGLLQAIPTHTCLAMVASKSSNSDDGAWENYNCTDNHAFVLCKKQKGISF